MRDFTPFIFALGLVIVMTVIVASFRHFLGKRVQEVEPKRESDVEIKASQPKPKCRHCDHDANHVPYKWVRDRGVFDLVRRAFGAPATLRLGRDIWATPAYCDVHVHLAYEEFRKEQFEYESDRARLESAWETRRAEFQRSVVDDRVRANIDKHKRELGGRKRRGAQVVPFDLSRQTGTDQK